MIAGIHHVAISTPDLERALWFYGDLLGGEVVFDTTWDRGMPVADAITNLEGSKARQVLLLVGGGYLELFEWSSPAPRAAAGDRPVCDHGITHFCLDVDDLWAAYKRLRHEGVRFHCPPQDLGAGVMCTYLRDPDGNVVELQELRPAADHPLAVREHVRA